MIVTFCGHSKIDYYTTVKNLLHLHTVIAYIKHDTGGAFRTFCYAKHKQKKIILL